MGPPDPLKTLVSRYDATAFDAAGKDRIRLRLSVDGDDPCDVLIENGLARLAPVNPEAAPDATLDADDATWQSMGSGLDSGMEAYRQGRLRLRRNLHLAVGFLAATSGNREPGRLAFRTVRTERARFSILEAGVGEPVVMLHGLGGTKISFLPVINELARGYRTIAADLPGFGDSGKPLGAAYDAEFYAQSVCQLLDELGIERAHVIGHSMGGRAALELGLTYPERVAGLVLMTPAVPWRKARPWAPYLKFIRPELGLLQLTPRSTIEAFLKRTVPGAESSWVAAGLDEFLRSYSTARGRAAFYAAARAIYLDEGDAPHGMWKRLAALQPTSLFLWGSRDELVPAAFERHVREALPGARHVKLETGHVPQLEDPVATNRAISGFLRSLPATEVAEAV